MNQNQLDYYFHEISMILVILTLFALVGFLLGSLISSRSRKKSKQLQRECQELRTQHDELKETIEDQISFP